MKKAATAAAMVLALSLPGLALAGGLKAGDKVNLCEKQGAYTLVQGAAKCDGKTMQGKLVTLKDGKLEVDLKGKKVMVDEPLAPAKAMKPAKAMTDKATPAVPAVPAVPAEPAKK